MTWNFDKSYTTRMLFQNIKHWTYTTFLRAGAIHNPSIEPRLFLHAPFPVWLKHPEVLPCFYNRPLLVSYQLLILRVLPLSSSCLPPTHLEEIGIPNCSPGSQMRVSPCRHKHIPPFREPQNNCGPFWMLRRESGSSALLFHLPQTPQGNHFFPKSTAG